MKQKYLQQLAKIYFLDISAKLSVKKNIFDKLCNYPPPPLWKKYFGKPKITEPPWKQNDFC